MKLSKEDLQRMRSLAKQDVVVMDKEQFLAILDLVEEQQAKLKDLEWYRDKCQYLESKNKELEDKLNA